jgi:hypothetical protein
METISSFRGRRAHEKYSACPREIAAWVSSRPELGIDGVPHDGEWYSEVDEDGSIYLILKDSPEPAFAIMPEPNGLEVLICDPEDTDTLGPFDSLAEALAGITAWLSWHSRSILIC